MININQTSKNSKIYIQREIKDNSYVNNTYVTNDELTEVLDEYVTDSELSEVLDTKQATLVSGENIKTINGNSILGEGNIEIDVDLDSKQDKLVSGTNIKTINNTSLLGYGNIAVQPSLVSGTNIKTINGNSILGSGDIIIEGGNGNIVELTQSEYNSITPEDDTLYVISDAPAVVIPDVSNFVDKDTLTYEIDAINLTLTQNYYTKNDIDVMIGDIETILDNIIG